MSNFEVINGDRLEFVGELPTNDGEALELSIQKWQEIVKLHEVDPYLEVDGLGPDTCGLCMLHWRYDCEGCPVMKKTGQTACDGTPFNAYCRAISDGDSLLEPANAELAFLEGLRGNNSGNTP